MEQQQSSKLKYYILVKNGLNSTYDHRKQLASYGLKFNRGNKCWKGIFVSDVLIDAIKMFCQDNGLKFKCYSEHQQRNTAYRQEFYKNNRPVYKDYYICAYCLLPHKKKKITVDHIIPVKKSRDNKLAQYLLKKMKIENVNDIRNLVAACQSCNARKGAKGGWWVIRGFLGKKKPFIIFVWLVWLLLFIAILTLMAIVLKMG